MKLTQEAIDRLYDIFDCYFDYEHCSKQTISEILSEIDFVFKKDDSSQSELEVEY